MNLHLLDEAVVDEVKASGTAESVNTQIPTVSTACLLALRLHSPLQLDWELGKTRTFPQLVTAAAPRRLMPFTSAASDMLQLMDKDLFSVRYRIH